MRSAIAWIRGIPAWYLLVPILLGLVRAVLGRGEASRVPPGRDSPVLDRRQADDLREQAGEQADAELDEISERYEGRRSRLLDKFRRKAPILVLGVMVANCGTARTHVPPVHPPDVDPVAVLEADCCLVEDPARDVVECPGPSFVEATIAMLAIQEALERAGVENRRLSALGAIDVQVERGARLEAEARLADPLRNPLLWGPVCAVLGAVVGALAFR